MADRSLADVATSLGMRDEPGIRSAARPAPGDPQEPASAQVLALAEPVRAMALRVRAQAVDLLWPYGRFEPPAEVALELVLFAATNTIACTDLSRFDLLFAQPACIIARGVMEASVTARWILAPDDPVTRKVRSVSHYMSEVERVTKTAKAYGYDPANEMELLDEMCRAHATILPDGTKVPKGMPSFKDRLDSLGDPHEHATYVALCQEAHATTHAVGRHRVQARACDPNGRMAANVDWRTALTCCWFHTVPACDRIAALIGKPQATFVQRALRREYAKAARVFPPWWTGPRKRRRTTKT